VIIEVSMSSVLSQPFKKIVYKALF
jgi:hypothetical protein